MVPRVSVVMPVYNGERYIGDAIRSVLDSRFTDFELLVVDDGSTDASLAEATRAANGDPRVRIVQVPHGGVAAARNAALREARAELVANLDADDIMPAYRLERQVAYMDAHPECVALGGRSLNVQNGRPLGLSGRYYTHDTIDASLLRGDGGALGSDTAMFRRDVVRAIGGYEEHLSRTGEDHDLWLRLAERGKLANLPDLLNYYRIHGSNMSTGAGSRERRLPITLANLSRAFARRGITDRTPEKIPGPPKRVWERWCDRALVLFFSGHRAGALFRVLGAFVFNPGSAATRSAIRCMTTGAGDRLREFRRMAVEVQHGVE